MEFEPLSIVRDRLSKAYPELSVSQLLNLSDIVQSFPEWRYQVSFHGAGKVSVQQFDASGALMADTNLANR